MTMASRTNLPPITTFLNRLLALRLICRACCLRPSRTCSERAHRGSAHCRRGLNDLGLETLRAESFRVTDARVIYTHPGSGAETQLLTITEKRRNTPTGARRLRSTGSMIPKHAFSSTAVQGRGGSAGARHQPDVG